MFVLLNKIDTSSQEELESAVQECSNVFPNAKILPISALKGFFIPELLNMIPQYNISGQSVTPEEIVDIIPEQEKSDREIQQNEERYFQQL